MAHKINKSSCVGLVLGLVLKRFAFLNSRAFYRLECENNSNKQLQNPDSGQQRPEPFQFKKS
jgi:hypothetical protein